LKGVRVSKLLKFKKDMQERLRNHDVGYRRRTGNSTSAAIQAISTALQGRNVKVLYDNIRLVKYHVSLFIKVFDALNIPYDYLKSSNEFRVLSAGDLNIKSIKLMTLRDLTPACNSGEQVVIEDII